jgi:hypothetical protein
MTISVHGTALGPGAYERLREVVDRVKAADRLAPVTVVVPTNSVGVAARRSLARHGRGIAGASFLTLYRLAELLGGATLAASGRMPVSNPIVGAAARRALRNVPGRFQAVAEHEATELALVRAHRELDDLDDDQLIQLSRASRRSHDVVALHRAIRTALAKSFHTERDLLDAAATAITQASSASSAIGTVVLFLPERVSLPGVRLLRALGAHHEMHVVAGVIGAPDLDAPLHELLSRLDAEPLADIAIEWPRIDVVVSISDPDDEARTVTRNVVAAARRGVPLEHIAIVFANREPYARLLHEHLTAAGVAHNGAAVRSLADSVAGRTLLSALALGDRDFRRSDVLAFAAGAPVRHDGRWVPATSWERISRQAGIVAGLPQWRDRLTVPSGDGAETAPGASVGGELLQFVERLSDRIERASVATRWSTLADVAREVLHDHLPGDYVRATWPPEEQRAFERVQLAVDRLGTLDVIEPKTNFATFRTALAVELDADLGKVGRIGEGVLLGSLSLALGVETEAVFVVGMAEGSFPSRARDDSLLPDADRVALDSFVLPDRRRRARHDERALWSALAFCTGERVLFHPRGDLRRTTDRPLSRYALDAIEVVSGIRPAAEALASHADEPWLQFVPSFAAGVRAAAFPATAQELRLAHLGSSAGSGAALESHPIVMADRPLALAVELLAARSSPSFTRFDGNLQSKPVARLAGPGDTVSPSRLETYTRNPLAYFLGYVLDIAVVTDPNAIERIQPLDLGSLFHHILELFVGEEIERADREAAPKSPHEQWSEAAQLRLHEIADTVCDDFERRGLTGRPLLWRHDRRGVHADLDRFVRTDNEHRATHVCSPIAVEMKFGWRAPLPAVTVPLADGRSVAVGGSADRIDRSADGGFCVIDYKTGRSGDVRKLSEANPDANGTKLQLPLYAHAARTYFGAADARVDSAYWFVTESGDYRTVTVPFTDAVEARVADVLTTIVTLAETGIFPFRADPPSSWGQPWPNVADPDGRGGAINSRLWQRKRGDPALAAYIALAEPDLSVEVPT